jgi:hypothetical protein
MASDAGGNIYPLLCVFTRYIDKHEEEVSDQGCELKAVVANA